MHRLFPVRCRSACRYAQNCDHRRIEIVSVKLFLALLARLTVGEIVVFEAAHPVEALREIAEENGFIFVGGHPMAAGMSLKKEKLTEFRQRLNGQTTLTEDDFVEKVWIDVAMPFGYITEKFINGLKKLEPFGNGNEKPVFAAKVTVSNYRIIGVNRNVLRMSLKDEYGTPLDAISFGDVQKFEERIKTGAPVIPILYYPEINEYNGIRSIQVVVTDYT